MRPGHPFQQHDGCGTLGCHYEAKPARKHWVCYKLRCTWLGAKLSRRLGAYLLSGQVTNTAAATTVVHNPSRSPIADWVTLRVVTILSDMRQMSLRSS